MHNVTKGIIAMNGVGRSRTVLLRLYMVFLLASVTSCTGTEPDSRRLWDGAAPGAKGNSPDDVPTLQFFPAPGSTPNAPTMAVLICPGGGYGGLAMDHEGHQIARWYNAMGASAFILNYRHRGKGYGHPAPLLDAQRAMRVIRAEAEKWNVDPQRIGVMGFSAGGHLASTLATKFDKGRPDAEDPIDRVSCRPDFAILCYPVIAFGERFTHAGSQRNLLGDNPPPELVRELSSEKQVPANAPPTFLFHTQEDQVVTVENSLAFFSALHAQGVPAALHVYPRGPHGVGLAQGIEGTKDWPGACIGWLRELGMLSAANASSTVE
jgi:acetyl esterase/lipase